MKVLMSKEGELEIQPESPLENFALQAWYEKWVLHQVTLSISLQEPHGSGYTNKVIKHD